MTITEVDPFDLPDWLGEGSTTWYSASSAPGFLAGHFSGPSGARLEADLMAADRAYPKPVLNDHWRTLVHRHWEHGQVALLRRDDRLTLVLPGNDISADDTVECIARFARAVGAFPRDFLVAIRAH